MQEPLEELAELKLTDNIRQLSDKYKLNRKNILDVWVVSLLIVENDARCSFSRSKHSSTMNNSIWSCKCCRKCAIHSMAKSIHICDRCFNAISSRYCPVIFEIFFLRKTSILCSARSVSIGREHSHVLGRAQFVRRRNGVPSMATGSRRRAAVEETNRIKSQNRLALGGTGRQAGLVRFGAH